MNEKLKKRLASKLYKLLKPTYQTLENFLKEELRKELQAEEYRKAEQKLKSFHERKPIVSSNFNFKPDLCNHLKGGMKRTRFYSKDYALGMHTFSDGSTKIFCTICRKEWDKNSPDWKEMQEMMFNSSSNTPSSSEVSFIKY